MRKILWIPFSLLFVCGLVEARGDNWPQFRGPGGQGLSSETEVPLKWNARENILWKTAIPGESWSTPIVWQDKIFVTTATEEGKSCRIVCLEAPSGKIHWDKEVFRQVPRKKETRNSYATPSPVTDGERVYAVFGDGSFAAVNFHGETVWTNREYPFYSQHGLGASPVLCDGVLVMTFDASSEGPDKLVGWQTPWDKSFVVGLDAKTGKQKWKTMRGISRISHGTPVIWTGPDGKKQVVTEAGDVVQGFDLQTGEKLWTSDVAGEGKCPSTLIGDGLVFTAGGFRGRESIKAFKLGGKGELKETNLVWEQKKVNPKVPSMIYVKPYLYAIQDNGIASCVKPETGEVLWQERVGGNVSASPVSAAGRIYFLDDKGDTTVIEASPKFRVLAKNSLGGRVQSSLAIANGRLYLRTENQLYCIGEK